MTDILDRRRDSIERSGWNRPFTVVQPRNFAFWVYLALVTVGAATIFPGLSRFASENQQIVAVVILTVGVFNALLAWVIHRLDRSPGRPVALITWCIVWGAFAATFAIAAAANLALGDLYGKLFGQQWSADWGAALSAPITEEIAKGLGVVLLIALSPRMIRTAFDGLVVGAYLGLGFQVLEDVAYALNSARTADGTDPFGEAVTTLVFRLVTGVAGHVAYSALFCAGLVYVIGRAAQPRRVGRGLTLIATAVGLHALWDGQTAVVRGNPAATFAMMIVLTVVTLAAVRAEYRRSVTTERDVMRTILAPEVASGIVTEQERDATCGGRRDRTAHRRGGVDRTDRRRRGQVLDAVAELSIALTESGGADTDDVTFARAEVSRIRR